MKLVSKPNVLKELFPGYKVFLCGVHFYRYVKDKELPSSKNRNGTAVEKGEILAQFRRVRDAPSEDLYIARRDQLLEMTEQLMVKPGNTKNEVAFSRYFNKNWESVREMCFLDGNQLYDI